MVRSPPKRRLEPTFGQGESVTFTGAGRLGARSGSGTFRRSDGCGGTWTSIKQ